MSRWTPLDLAEALSRGHVRLARESPLNPKTPARVAIGGSDASTGPSKGQNSPSRKYRNRPVEHEGVKFDSQKEFQRYLDLKLLERGKQITNLQVHPKYIFEHNGVRIGSYKADFSYVENAILIVEDCKSIPTKTQAYRLRKRMMLAFHGIVVKET